MITIIIIDNHNDHHHHPPHHPHHDKDFTSLEEQSWSSRQSAHRDPSLQRFLFPSASIEKFSQKFNLGGFLKNLMTGGYPLPMWQRV